jgi:prolyl 4-hydroxylase
MFEMILASPANEQYNVTIHSSPASYKDHEEGHDDGPWVITLDDFLSPAECERMIQLGHDIEYTRSEDVGAKKFDGTYEAIVSKDRTSTTAWCIDDDCFKDPVTLAVRERIEELTGIPDVNSEYLQILRYEETQRYGVHHDYIDTLRERAQGVRILTVFLYLGDVEAGGGTHFPKLDLTVMPKQGRVLIWPSVLNSAPDDIDERTDHEALPVEAGIKYSANGWIHARDFKTPFAKGCT